MKIFTKLYDKYFPIRKINIKPKRTLSTWIRDGIAKSSKRKQKLYEKLFRTPHAYKRSQLRLKKNLFEATKTQIQEKIVFRKTYKISR